MRSSKLRKSLAASAVLASSVASAAGFAASAQAAPGGPSNSPLTVGKGSWAPDGSRYVHANPDGSIATRNLPGGAEIIVDPAKSGVARSNPTFWNDGTGIVFSESVNGGPAKLVVIPTYTPAGDPVPETDPLTTFGGTFHEGGDTAPDANGETLTFQHRNTATNQDDIYVQDDNGRGSLGPILAAANGTSPTVSPDGKTVAFLRKDSAGDEQVWTVAWNGQASHPAAGTPKQITTDAHDHLAPTFSPDGTRIAFEQGPGHGAAATSVQSIATDGSGLRQESATPGAPHYQPLVKDTLTRLAGDDRFGTAIAASQARFKAGEADSVVLSRSDDFADALGGSALATMKRGPLLLTPTGSLDAHVKAEIARVLGPAASNHQKTVYVLGGEQALSPAVYNAVKGMGYTVQRISGTDRYATSVAIAKQITDFDESDGWGQPGRVLVATGVKFPDALSAGAAADAGSYNGPIGGVVVLTDGAQMPKVTKDYLAQVEAHSVAADPTPVYGVGGPADTALTSVGIQHKGLVGGDRYQTSYLVAKTFFGSWETASAPTSVGLATGANWPDALSGGAFMGQTGGPLLLVDPNQWLTTNGPQQYFYGWAPATSNAYIFGGDAVIDGVSQSNTGSGISGPAGYTYQANPKA